MLERPPQIEQKHFGPFKTMTHGDMKSLTLTLATKTQSQGGHPDLGTCFGGFGGLGALAFSRSQVLQLTAGQSSSKSFPSCSLVPLTPAVLAPICYLRLLFLPVKEKKSPSFKESSSPGRFPMKPMVLFLQGLPHTGTTWGPAPKYMFIISINPFLSPPLPYP